MTNSVLVVEDDFLTATILTRFLEVSGFQVYTSQDGLSGLEQLRQHPEIKFCYVDLNMPTMDGYAFIETVTKNRTGTQPNIFVTSAYDRAKFQDTAKNRSIDLSLVKGFFQKPYDTDVLS